MVSSFFVKNQGLVPALGFSHAGIFVSPPTVTNLGGSVGTFSVGVYLSTNSVITTDDQLLKISSTGALLAGQSFTFDTSSFDTVFLNPTTPTEKYWIGFIADYGNLVLESNENNNVGPAKEFRISNP